MYRLAMMLLGLLAPIAVPGSAPDAHDFDIAQSAIVGAAGPMTGNGYSLKGTISVVGAEELTVEGCTLTTGFPAWEAGGAIGWGRVAYLPIIRDDYGVHLELCQRPSPE